MPFLGVGAVGGGVGAAGGLGGLSGLGSLLGNAGGAASGALTAGLPGFQEIQRAQQQANFRERSFRATSGAVHKSLVSQYGALQRRHREEAASLSQSQLEIERDAAQAASSANLASAESGAGGGGELIRDVMTRDAQQQQALLRAYQIRERALLDQPEAIRMDAYQKLLAAVGGPIAAPDVIGATMKTAIPIAGLLA